MSSESKIGNIERSASRLRVAVFVAMGTMIVLYVVARLGLQFGHVRVEYQEQGDGTFASRLISDVCIGLLVVALFRLTQLLKLIAGGNLFGIEVIRRFRSFAWWLLLMSVLELIGPTLGELFESASGGPHQVRFAIESRDLLFLGITVFLFLLARLLERARTIDEEMREIV